MSPTVTPLTPYLIFPLRVVWGSNRGLQYVVETQETSGSGGGGNLAWEFGVPVVVALSVCLDQRYVVKITNGSLLRLVRVVVDVLEVTLLSQCKSPPGLVLSRIRVQSRILQI